MPKVPKGVEGCKDCQSLDLLLRVAAAGEAVNE